MNSFCLVKINETINSLKTQWINVSYWVKSNKYDFTKIKIIKYYGIISLWTPRNNHSNRFLSKTKKP